jgi:hypothetical protein
MGFWIDFRNASSPGACVSKTFIIAAVILHVGLVDRPQNERAVVLQLWVVSTRREVVSMGLLTVG